MYDAKLFSSNNIYEHCILSLKLLQELVLFYFGGVFLKGLNYEFLTERGNAALMN